MDRRGDKLCPKCSEIIHGGAIWHDHSSHAPQQSLGFLETRKFREIYNNSANCALCRLARTALKIEKRYHTPDPNLESTIYYSRILYSRFYSGSSVSDTSERQSVPQQHTNLLEPHSSYRLRVSETFQYKVDHTDKLEYIRQFQGRSCDECSYSTHPREGEIMLLCKETDGNRFFNGRRMGSCFDFNVAKSWISECNKDHNHSNIRESSLKTPTNRLINIRLRMVQKAPRGCSYAALSYCWGPNHVEQVRLNRDTEKDLTKPWGLENFDIPKTIRDAIVVCENLGIQYLWVDALCHPHGTENQYTWERKMVNISSIFASAHLTIVANGEDSHSGLPCIYGSKTRQFSEQIEGLSLAVSQPFIDDSMYGSNWKYRVWTYDEWNQSRRLLFFTDHQVFFVCKQGGRIYCEDTHCELPADNSTYFQDVQLPHLDAFWAGGSLTGFERYVLEVQEFSARQITAPTDWTIAFQSAKNMMATGLGKEYIHDLPVTCFAQALCFEVFSGKRRTINGSPSWSWQGWEVAKCKLYYYSTHDIYKPIVTFYHAERRLGTNRFRYIRVNTKQGWEEYVQDSLRVYEICKAVFEADPISAAEEDLYGVKRFPSSRAHKRKLKSGELEFLPSSEVLDTLSFEEKGQLIAFRAPTVELRISIKASGYWELLLPNDGKLPVGQAILNTEEDHREGSIVKCVFIAECQDEEGSEVSFFLVTKEVKNRVSRRIGSCTVDETSKIQDGWASEEIYLI